MFIKPVRMIRNFKLRIEYDGTNFSGWQRQKSDRTVQGEIEAAICKMTEKKVSLIGSGRTDAGVHALGQVANFLCDTHLTADIFLKGLNSLVADDVVILSCEETDAAFHARYDVKSKTYHYRILNQPIRSAIQKRYAWHISRPLNVDAMTVAIEHFKGKHDFKAFEGTGSPRSSTIRNIFSVSLHHEGFGFLRFEISADGFLKCMVRNIVGTLVEVGMEKLKPDDIQAILQSGNRANAGPTAPAKGLFLIHAEYENTKDINPSAENPGQSAAGDNYNDIQGGFC